MRTFQSECAIRTANLYPPSYGALQLSASVRATAFVREHRPAGARQHQIQLHDRAVTTTLREGAYTVVVQSPGFTTERRFVQISPGSTEYLRVDLQAAHPRRYIDAQERLVVKYGITSPKPLPERLAIGERQHVVLGREDKAHTYGIQIESPQQLKQVIGNADHYAVSRHPVFGEIVQRAPQDFDSDRLSFEARAVLREFVDGNSASVDSSWLPFLTLWVAEIVFVLVACKIVDVGPWGVLEIGNATNILTCDLLRVHETGTVLVTGDQPVQIDTGEYESYT